ncbi:DUF2865 domain-containing protein [Ochrobactrum sp. CGA5]|uniref:DUF2865 domain-containing protein n=1 Tax=Ochrobactrum sp. CGA5 TaxID=2583453 RepID=UPI001FFFB902|nr:DUF2865 domain-containing protein [Ochrobactrum sp. CGA5]
MTQRQLSALRALERSRSCKKGDERGGFFNPCRDLAQRIAAIQRQLASSSLSSRSCVEQPTASQPAKVKLERPKTSPVAANSKPWGASGLKGALTYCVRLSDGYLFPAPHSQFQKSDNVTETMARCRFICQGQNVDLYVLNDPNGETADMVSVTNGKPYVELPTAYNYHDSREFQKCDWAGYVSKISELRANNKGARAFKNVVVPMPDMRPVRNDTDSVSTASFAPITDRNVRIVGPAFIFDEGTGNAKPSVF